MKLKKKTKIILIVVAVLVVLLLTLLLFSDQSLIADVLWTLLILGVGFFAIECWSRAKKKKKQRAFDEKVSAKEGIEDRKREWQGWVDELEKQGIDRYELPFYLVVGEPQSGKSVLLQNSDLYFPFGQERLSGVGGTRGCDWWFTDEAVILDIAGRLFTHEGGVADKLEWESFLDQLNLFRPMSPANGVLLVIPCDALLEDSPEVCAEKANKIQSALLTLTQKLEAQLPVYLVLTKGDRIFGFAETVHRMDSEQRHQMFGWSREPDKAEQPFALEEAKSGFSRMVDRARLLRERMISTARLPEALPEIDRLYAFPDELAGMYGSLEIYLKRIFTESNLVDRASFRGIYLTSGLQTGAPIARVCAELLGDDRESDSRALEGLFSHQRAYFIKDLVRKRVFAERGLVRPTEGRVASTRRKAVIGYGAAGLLALASIVGAVVHVWQGPEVSVQAELTKAIKAAGNVTKSDDVGTLLVRLATLDQAITVKRGLMEEAFGETRDELRALYLKVCETALVPALRVAVEKQLQRKVGALGSAFSESVKAADVKQWIKDVQQLTVDVEFGGEDGLKLVKDHLSLPTGQGDFTVEDALAEHGDWPSPVGERSRVVALAKRAKELLQGLMDPRNHWMIEGHVGYMVAMDGAEKALKKFGKPSPELRRERGVIEQCDLFSNAVGKLAGTRLKVVTWVGWKPEVGGLLADWRGLSTFLKPGDEAPWAEMKEHMDMAGAVFAENTGHGEYQVQTGFSGQTGIFAAKLFADVQGDASAGFDAKENPVGQWINSSEYEQCRDYPHSDWTLRSIKGRLATVEGKPKRDPVYLSKVNELASELHHDIPNWNAAQARFYEKPEDAPKAGELDIELLAALATIFDELSLYDFPSRSVAKSGQERVSTLLSEHLSAVADKWLEQRQGEGEVNWDIVGSLEGLAANEVLRRDARNVTDDARLLVWQYLRPFQAKLLSSWREFGPHCSLTLKFIDELKDRLSQLGVKEGTPVDLGSGHREWLKEVSKALVKRLKAHQAGLENHWKLTTDGWSRLTLAEVSDGVVEALSDREIQKKIRSDLDQRVAKLSNGGDGVGWPLDSASVLRDIRPIPALEAFKAVDELVAQFRNAGVPTFPQIGDHPMSVAAKDVIERLRGDPDDAELAQLAVGMKLLKSKAGTAAKADPKADTRIAAPADIYATAIYKGLRDRLVREVRLRYLKQLQGLVQSSESSVLDALYAGSKDLNTVGKIRDKDFMAKLAKLLDSDLGDLLPKYKMDRAAGADHLHPGTGRADLPNSDWWAFESFLSQLQVCLRGPDNVKTNMVKFRVQMTPVQPSAEWEGAWALDGKNRSRCNFSVKTGKDAEGEVVTYSAEGTGWAKMKNYPLAWAFRVGSGRQPVMWFTWTSNSDCLRQSDARLGDLTFELSGSLAPLLWCWSGPQDMENELGCLVEARAKPFKTGADGEVESVGRPAALRLKLLPFDKKDNKPLFIPKRPAKPQSKLK